MSWFECKVKYDKMQENGTVKTVSEPYLVNALSFTEAEARITEEISPFISGEFNVAAVKRDNLAEIFYDEKGDKWYKVKTVFITIDERSGVEKKKASFILVQAACFKDALDNFMNGMKGTIADFEIASITETALMDVYRENLSGAKPAAAAKE